MSVTFSNAEIKGLILALARSKPAPEVEETPKHEADPKDKSEDKAEKDDAGVPHESSKDMLVRKLKDGGSK